MKIKNISNTAESTIIKKTLSKSQIKFLKVIYKKPEKITEEELNKLYDEQLKKTA